MVKLKFSKVCIVVIFLDEEMIEDMQTFFVRIHKDKTYDGRKLLMIFNPYKGREAGNEYMCVKQIPTLFIS